MGCLSVREDIPRALASGVSYVKVDKHYILLFYTTYISVDLAHHEIFRAKVGKGGIIYDILGCHLYIFELYIFNIFTGILIIFGRLTYCSVKRQRELICYLVRLYYAIININFGIHEDISLAKLIFTGAARLR